MRELETPRLRLRKIRREDAQRIFDCWASDPAVTRWLTWPPHESVAVTEKVMDMWLAEYEKPNVYRYGIELKESGALIGMIDVVRIVDGCPEIGYCSGRPTWGRGYMTEALKAVCAMLFEDGFPAILIRAVRENIGSNRVIQKAGFSFTGTETGPMWRGKNEIVTVTNYRLDRE